MSLQTVTLPSEDWDEIKGCIVLTQQEFAVSEEESAKYFALVDRIDAQLAVTP